MHRWASRQIPLAGRAIEPPALAAGLVAILLAPLIHGPRCYAHRRSWRYPRRVTHPTLGLPPRSLTAGFPDAAARLRSQRAPLAARALEVAAREDPTLRTRHDDTGLRNLLKDAEVLVERLALCVAGNDTFWLKEFADHSATVFRRRGVGMDDVMNLCEALRTGARALLSEDEMVPADKALDAAIAVYRRYRGVAGDAHKRGRIAAAIYKGI
jgi:hypothetical protein